MATTTPVFLVEELPAHEQAVLAGPEGRHAATVRRLEQGELLVLADGKGGRATCEITGVERDALTLQVVGRAFEMPPTPRVVLAQALLKGDRGELAVELATEAGVDAIVPWRASRSVTRWDDGPRGHKALARWRSTVREAAKQSRRGWVPEVSEPVSTTGLVELSRSTRCLVLHESAEHRLANADVMDSNDVLLVVGPEGGISDQELDALTAVGAIPVRLGPTVLRASTAAAVALGALGVLTQRWNDLTIIER